MSLKDKFSDQLKENTGKKKSEAESKKNKLARLEEIGILRALGMATPRLVAIFLSRAFLTGIAGALAGGLAGLLAGTVWGETSGLILPFDPALWLGVLLGAPLLAALASWLPALWAARQDPVVDDEVDTPEEHEDRYDPVDRVRVVGAERPIPG